MVFIERLRSIFYFLFMLWNINFADENAKQSNGSDVVQFEPYKPSESYKCGQFIESSINDPAMRLFHHFNNAFIKLLFQPFPHEKLLTSEALLGKPEAWRSSLETNHQEWIKFEKYWLAICAAIVVLPSVFTVLYLLYRCCMCCCRVGKKSKHTDNKFDNYKRIILNIVLAAFVVVNVFAAVVLLINTQYAQYSIEELPTRLHYCVNDFSVYKIETNERIRKLLRDDFQVLNATLIRNFENVGANVVNNFKKSTGLSVVDDLLDNTRKSESIHRDLLKIAKDLKQLYSAKALLSKKFSKLKESEDALDKCRLASNVAKAGVCESAWRLIQPLLNNRIEYNIEILPEGTAETIQQIIDLKMESKFSQLLEQLDAIRSGIQGFVDGRQSDALERLKSLEETLFRLYEDISAAIKSVDLRFLDDIVDPMMQNRENFHNYVQYSWIISLIVTGIFVFIALSFLLGLFYGCCGRRPSYHDDDCCVRSTGGKFYACGIWMCLAFMTFFAVITATLLFVGANASSLICLPLEDPLSRPDMMSLLDRMVEVYGLSEEAKLPLSQDHHIPQIFSSKHRPLDIIKGCKRGATFYTMFEGLDKKFQLTNQGGPGDEYEILSEEIKGLSSSNTFTLNNIDSFYNQNAKAALKKLGEMHVPSINQSGLIELRSWTSHFNVDPLLHQLKKITADKSSVPMPEVDVVVAYLEALKPDAQLLLTQMNDLTIRLKKLALDLESMQLNATDISSQLQHTSSLLAVHQMSDKLYTSANEVVVNDLVGNIARYAQHINYSMMTEISSCAPIITIAQHTRAAVCDYTLDPFNGVWMAMAISLMLMLPIIMLSTSLTNLYSRIHPFPKYIINEPSNDATFATDTIYGPGLVEQHRTKPSHSSTSPYTPVSNYANNYGYHEFYPPPYGHRGI